jgi:chemotaxis protein MotB
LSRKKSNHEEEGNSERWLVSYADFITLLFAFFTTLYAISTVDAAKYGRMVMSTKAAFDNGIFNQQGSRTLTLNPGDGGKDSSGGIFSNPARKGSSDPKDKTLKDLETLKHASSKRSVVDGEIAMGRLKRGVETLLAKDVLKGRVRTRLDSRGLIVSLGENGVFDSGSDQIRPEGKALLDTLATSLVSLGNYVRIEGHTDNVPIRTTRFPSNWELSTARATAVVSRLVADFGMRPELISAAGYAEFRPCAPNDTEDGRARNRRVDIIVLNPAAARVEPK